MTTPFRLGFMTHLRGTDDPHRAYAEAKAMFIAADQLGFDVGWVAQHHFTRTEGFLGAPLPFLAAVAERTKQIRLGTSIIVLPLESPLRLAEDAAVVDFLSSGRLELGVGSGSDPREFEAFAVDMATRHEKTSDGIQILKRALSNEPLGEQGQTLQPPVPSLGDRLWLSGLSILGAEYAAKFEAGLLLSRAAWGKAEPTDVVQLPVTQAYLKSWQKTDAKPRVGLSRGIYVGQDKKSTLQTMEPDVSRAMKQMVTQGRIPAGLSIAEYCNRIFAYGHPEEAAEMLNQDQVLPYTTDLILQFDPVFPDLDQAIHMLELIATQVGPRLGWKPNSH